MTIILLIGLLIYNFILTLFVVKLHNKFAEIIEKFNVKTTTKEDTYPPAQKELVEISQIPSVENSVLTQRSVTQQSSTNSSIQPVETLDEITLKLNTELNKKSQSDIDKWLEMDKIREQERIKKLNESYNKQY